MNFGVIINVMKNPPTTQPFLFSMIPNRYTTEVYLNLLMLKSNILKADALDIKSGKKALRRIHKANISILNIASLNRGNYLVRLYAKNFNMTYTYRFEKL
jgi:hypothetical protein